MKTFEKWFEDNYNEKMPKGDVSLKWFEEQCLLPIACYTCCGGIMSLPDSIVAEDGHLYCPSCAEGCVEEEEE